MLLKDMAQRQAEEDIIHRQMVASEERLGRCAHTSTLASPTLRRRHAQATYARRYFAAVSSDFRHLRNTQRFKKAAVPAANMDCAHAESAPAAASPDASPAATSEGDIHSDGMPPPPPMPAAPPRPY